MAIIQLKLMQNDNSEKPSQGPFKAKLKHYHRTASPDLYSKKQKRWEDVSANDFSDSAVHHSKNKPVPNLSIKLTRPKDEKSEE